jgi:hypothetical protein
MHEKKNIDKDNLMPKKRKKPFYSIEALSLIEKG